MFRSILTIIRECYEVHGKVTEVYWRYVFQYVGGMPCKHRLGVCKQP